MPYSSQLLSLLLVLAALTSLCLTAYIRKIALKKGLVDIPNQRSSHTIAKPRGGGFAIVLTFCVFFGFMGVGHPTKYSIIIAATLTALIGMADDIQDRTAKERLSIHAISAAFVTYAVAGLPPIDFGFGDVELGLFGYVVATLGTMWMINLTNFMDGVDGLVASQIAIACLTICALIVNTGLPTELTLGPAFLVAGILGFLPFNLPPARIFLGDVGSGALGLIVSAFMLTLVQHGSEWLYAWLILLGLMVVDSTYTLIIRALRKEKLYEGHRTHAYQKLASRWKSHRKVTLLYAAVQIFWLTPLTWLVASMILPEFWTMLMAYLPITLACVYIRAGKE